MRTLTLVAAAAAVAGSLLAQNPQSATAGTPCFVPNLGQWPHAARFVHRSSGMTVFVEDRGWTLDLRDGQHDDRAAAVRMTFQGPGSVEPTGEGVLPGVCNYFLGADPARWRTAVPRYASVRYERLYPGIDLRLREHDGAPEYDLLLAPGADLDTVAVRVAGADALSVRDDGALVVSTPLGPLVQPRPHTWQVDAEGRQRPVACAFVLLGPDRFGFAAPGWNRAASLVIDPGLLWSTYLGGSDLEDARSVSVDARGVATFVGSTSSTDFPTTVGAYSGVVRRGDTFVCQLDPRQPGAAQLVYCTVIGGSAADSALNACVDDHGVVTVVGTTNSSDFPTTPNGYARTLGGVSDAFVCQLDPRQTGSAQLAYSTLLGGTVTDGATAVVVSTSGITVAGVTTSSDFPTTPNAFGRTYRGGLGGDAFVTRLDPRLTGGAQLVYSTLLGGSQFDRVNSMFVRAGRITVGGVTASVDFPTTPNAYDRTYNGGPSDGFVCQLDPQGTGAAQLTYGTYFGGNDADGVTIGLDARGVVSLGLSTHSTNLPTTPGAYDTTPGGFLRSDGFVAQLDPSLAGPAQLRYATYLGGPADDGIAALHVQDDGVVTVGGSAGNMFPTTAGAYQTQARTFAGFITRLDPRETGTAQLVYSTYFGGTDPARVTCLTVDPAGVTTVGGVARAGLPTTPGAYDASHNGLDDTFVARLDTGVAFYADAYEIPLGTGGTQRFTLNAGAAHAGRAYSVLGSFTGTTPGVTLGAVHIPLNPDAWTSASAALANTPVFVNSLGVLDPNGSAQAAFTLPSLNLPSAVGLVLHHAYLVFDGSGTLYRSSNAVPVTLVQ